MNIYKESDDAKGSVHHLNATEAFSTLAKAQAIQAGTDVAIEIKLLSLSHRLKGPFYNFTVW